MTLAEFFQAIHDGGVITLLIAGLFPIVSTGIAWILNESDYPRASQTVANVSVALGIVSLAVEIIVLVYGRQFGVDVLREVDLSMLFVPPYLVVAGFVGEHWVHPGRQEALRAQIRSGLFALILLFIGYLILSRLHILVLVWTSLFGLLGFLAALLIVLYLMIRAAI